MKKEKLIRITTVPLSLEKLLEGQLSFMNSYFDVIAVSADQEKLELVGKKEGVKTHHVNMTRTISPLHDLKSLFQLYRFLKKEKPTIVHTHTPKAGIIGMLASYFAGVPLRLHTVAGLPLMEETGIKRSILNWVEKITYSCAKKVYPNSKGLYDFIVNEKFTSEKKLKIIGNGSSNGIDSSYFSEENVSEKTLLTIKQDLNLSEDDFIFVFVGRIVRDKGIHEMIRSFVEVSNSHKNVKLILVGSQEPELDPIDADVLDIITSHKQILEVGFQQDVRPYFAVANALVFPSYREGFPNVVMQAGAMNLPAIVSNINGCNEIIKDGYNGIIVPVKNEVDLQKAMLKLFLDKSFYTLCKHNSRENIVQSYERKQVQNALLDEYKDLIKLL